MCVRREAKILTAVIMTAPGTLLMAKMLVPETEEPLTAGRVQMPEMEKEPNFLGAISRGTSNGLQLAINVAAMLISFVALVALVNYLFSGVHNALAAYGIGWFPSSLQQIFGWVFAPVAWLIGISWHDAPTVGNLLGSRMVVNELYAFSQLGPMKDTLDPRSFTIATFALCGFANFSSIGIQIGGIGALAPEARAARKGHSRHAGRHHGQLDVRGHRRNSYMSPKKTKKKTAKQAPELPEFALPGFASGESLSEFERAGLAADFISSRSPLKPEIALVLGSGLGAFAERFKPNKIPTADSFFSIHGHRPRR
jgi:hypothetical protein